MNNFQKVKQKFLNINPSLRFLVLSIFVYLLLAVFNFEIFKSSLFRFIFLFQKIFPSILGAFFLIFIFNYILSNQRIKKFLIAKSGWKQFLLTIILGILSSGPIYAWYPFLADLKKQGFRDGLISIFLYNRAIKLPFIPLIIYYFSLKFVILITSLMIIFSIINGLIINVVIPSQSK